jgi:hypothetical protein
MRHSGTSSLTYFAYGLGDTFTVIMLASSTVARHFRPNGIYSYKLEVQVVILEGFLSSVKIIA